VGGIVRPTAAAAFGLITDSLRGLRLARSTYYDEPTPPAEQAVKLKDERLATFVC
jgi:hypothetical protein